MRTEFITDVFEFSHGHAPRGRGWWAFALDRRCDNPVFVPGSLLYAEAKRKAIAIFTERTGSKPDALYVCP